MKRKFIIAALVIFVACFFVGCESFIYIPIETDTITVMADRGLSIAVYEDDSLRIRVLAADEKEYIKFDVEITNRGVAPIHVAEKCAKIRQGTDWDAMNAAKNTYTATAFYKKEAEAAATTTCCLAVAAMASTVNVAKNNTWSNRLNAYHAYDNLGDQVEESADYLDFLKHSLLYDTDILPDSSYFGVVFGSLWSPGSGSPVKKTSNKVSITLSVNGNTCQFLFDREKAK